MCVSLSRSLSLCLSLHEVYFGALFRSEDRQPPLLVELLSALFISAAVLENNNNPHTGFILFCSTMLCQDITNYIT